MKKLSFLLALAMIFCFLTSCGSENKAPLKGSNENANAAEPNPNAAILLDSANLSMPIGAKIEINASLIPRFDTDDKTLTFESANPTVATVTANGNVGIVEALAEGSTVITVKSADGLLAASCDIKVTDDTVIPPDPTGGSIIPENASFTIKVGDSGKILAQVNPASPGDSTELSFHTQSDCIELQADGSYTATGIGVATVTLSTAAGLSATVTITVLAKDDHTPTPNPNAGITLDKTSLSLVEGTSGSIKATLIPRFDTDSTVLTFKSSSNAVAKVSSQGVITAVSAGTAVITVTSADGLLSASCTVTVTAKPSIEPLEIVDYPASKVRHIFSHCLIAYPEMGCGDPAKGNGSLDIDCLTVSEFQILLQSLYDNGFCLIDINDMYENYTENGVVKSRLKKNVQVYKGKKPLVISVDDVVYDSRKLDWGMIDRLEIQNDTIVGMKMIDKKAVYSDKEIFPQLEKFIATHPDFSFQGAKCTLALTGFEGILGYRTDDSFANYESEREKAKVVVDWLKENGYNFASHSYSHSSYQTCSQDRVNRDIERWNSQVKPLIGETQVFVYPYGAFTYYGTETHNKLLSEGFTIFCGTAQTNCLWDNKHPKQRDSSGSTIAQNTGSIYLERYTITGQTLRDWRDYESFYEYCDPYATYDHENRFIPMPAKSDDE
ncbi:MAG: Ig domain-containing protein [Ruminococcaceae bacterium]|nr:Ig domain-containing protein [Oscillospiraceae bacterium]